MAAGGPITRAEIGAMSVAEFDARQDELMRWTGAGGVDGEPAPVLERPAGHVFTRAEIGAMSPAEFTANEQAIDAQARTVGVS